MIARHGKPFPFRGGDGAGGRPVPPYVSSDPHPAPSPEGEGL